MNQSKRFTLNRADVEKWGMNMFIFLGPTLVILIGSIVKIVPQDAKYGAVTLYILNVLVDLLKKFLQGNTK